MSRTCIIGDVHGMTELLQALLRKLNLKFGDTLVSLGDLVDKGPDPIGCVELLAEMQRDAPWATILVEANHEDKHLRYQQNLISRPKVARQMAERSTDLQYLHESLSGDGRAFLQSAKLFYRIPSHNVLCVHGGIPGNMNTFPDQPDEIHAMPKKDQNWYRQILRTRYINAETGAFRSLGKEEDGDPFWAEIYDGRFGHVVFGHQPFFDGPAEFTHATGIDTGAVDGGSLTALILNQNGTREYVSVPSEYVGRSTTRANPPLR